MALRFPLSCLLIFCIGGCSLLGLDDDGNYPTVLKPLPGAKVERLEAEFDRLNDDELCTNLNQFGLTEDTGFCGTTDSNVAITDTARIRQMVKAVLTRNAKFTNVESESSIRFEDIVSFQNDNTEWKVNVADQRYKGIPVLHSRISLWLTGSGVYRISGYWYDDIKIPAIDRYSPEEVKENLIGQTFTWHSGWIGEQSFTITRESIAEKAQKMIVPVKSDEKIELHVTWRIGITQAGEHEHPLWYFYIDTTTGKRVRTLQLFET